MTAHEFIAQLFSRPAFGLASNMRRLTAAQLKLLRELIDQDEEGAATVPGTGGSTLWMPSGRWKYVLTEDPRGKKHTLTRLGNITPSAMGTLF